MSRLSFEEYYSDSTADQEVPLFSDSDDHEETQFGEARVTLTLPEEDATDEEILKRRYKLLGIVQVILGCLMIIISITVNAIRGLGSGTLILSGYIIPILLILAGGFGIRASKNGKMCPTISSKVLILFCSITSIIAVTLITKFAVLGVIDTGELIVCIIFNVIEFGLSIFQSCMFCCGSRLGQKPRRMQYLEDKFLPDRSIKKCRILGVLQIVLGILIALPLTLIYIAYVYIMMSPDQPQITHKNMTITEIEFGPGLFSLLVDLTILGITDPLFYILSGSFGIAASKTQLKCPTLASGIFSIFCSVFSMFSLLLTITSKFSVEFTIDKRITLSLTIIITIVRVIGLGISYVQAALTFRCQGCPGRRKRLAAAEEHRRVGNNNIKYDEIAEELGNVLGINL